MNLKIQRQTKSTKSPEDCKCPMENRHIKGCRGVPPPLQGWIKGPIGWSSGPSDVCFPLDNLIRNCLINLCSYLEPKSAPEPYNPKGGIIDTEVNPIIGGTIWRILLHFEKLRNNQCFLNQFFTSSRMFYNWRRWPSKYIPANSSWSDFLKQISLTCLSY